MVNRLPNPDGMSDAEKISVLYEYTFKILEELDARLEQIEKEREKK